MRKAILVLMLGLVLVFAAAGCGGGDDESSATTDETTTEETGGTTGEEAENELYASVGPGFEISLTTEDGDDDPRARRGERVREVDTARDVARGRRSGCRNIRVRVRPACELDERELRSLRIAPLRSLTRQRCTRRAVRTRLPRA